uniref:Uncharacterized protein n=1 Tax=Calidris pygmaea TaxID=425635 RepID=A0A8C3JGR2_9CHAR
MGPTEDLRGGPAEGTRVSGPLPDRPRPPLTFVPPALPCQLHPSPLKRSLSLVPGSPQGGGSEWGGGGSGTPPTPGGDEAAVPGPPPRPPFGDHAPLSPQSSVASSGSEQTEEPAGGRNTFQEDGSGMKGLGGDAPHNPLGGVRGICHPPLSPFCVCPPQKKRCPLLAEEPAAAQIRGAFLPNDLRGDDDADGASPRVAERHQGRPAQDRPQHPEAAGAAERPQGAGEGHPGGGQPLDGAAGAAADHGDPHQGLPAPPRRPPAPQRHPRCRGGHRRLPPPPGHRRRSPRRPRPRRGHPGAVHPRHGQSVHPAAGVAAGRGEHHQLPPAPREVPEPRGGAGGGGACGV